MVMYIVSAWMLNLIGSKRRAENKLQTEAVILHRDIFLEQDWKLVKLYILYFGPS